MRKAAERLGTLIPFAVGVAGGAVGAFLTWWVQGRDPEHVAAIVSAIAIFVTIVGWYRSTDLAARSQRELLHLQLLNDARKELREELLRDEENLRRCAVRLHVHLYPSAPVDLSFRIETAAILRAEGHPNTAFEWVLALEEHAALFPELGQCRQQLSLRRKKLCEEFDRFAVLFSAPGALPPRFNDAVEELQSHVQDQWALLQDIRVHIQNRALGAVSGHHAPERQPPDPRVPRLVLKEGTLMVNVPDDARRAKMEAAGWLPSV